MGVRYVQAKDSWTGTFLKGAEPINVLKVPLADALPGRIEFLHIAAVAHHRIAVVQTLGVPGAWELSDLPDNLAGGIHFNHATGPLLDDQRVAVLQPSRRGSVGSRERGHRLATGVHLGHAALAGLADQR